MPQTVSFARMMLLFLCLVPLLPTTGQAAPHDSLAVKVEQVLGLRAFLLETYSGNPTVKVWSVDLDLPGDQVDELILHFDDIGYCGSGGCEWSIVRRNPDGSLVTIASILAGDVRLQPNRKTRLQQVIAQTRNGERSLDIVGKTSANAPVSRKQKPKAGHHAKRVEGPCQEGFFWSGGPYQQGGILSYVSCERDHAPVRFVCNPNGIITLTFSIEPSSYQNGDTVPALLSVIRKRETSFHPMPGQLSVSEMNGPTLTIPFDRANGFLDALKKGDRAMFNASISKLDLHLKGSAKAINAMLRACAR